MSEEELIDQKIEKSLKLLRGWGWMCTISTRRDEAISILSEEALSLVKLGTQHPGRARQIGTLIVKYERLITRYRGESRR